MKSQTTQPRQIWLSSLQKAKEQGNASVYDYAQKMSDNLNELDAKFKSNSHTSPKHTFLTDAFSVMDLEKDPAVVAKFVANFVIPYFQTNNLSKKILETHYINPLEQNTMVYSYLMDNLEGKEQICYATEIDTQFDEAMQKLSETTAPCTMGKI